MCLSIYDECTIHHRCLKHWRLLRRGDSHHTKLSVAPISFFFLRRKQYKQKEREGKKYYCFCFLSLSLFICVYWIEGKNMKFHAVKVKSTVIWIHELVPFYTCMNIYFAIRITLNYVFSKKRVPMRHARIEQKKNYSEDNIAYRSIHIHLRLYVENCSVVFAFDSGY